MLSILNYLLILIFANRTFASGIHAGKRESAVDLNGQKVMLTAYEFIQEGKEGASTSSDLDGHSATSRLSDIVGSSQLKKRRGHRRLGSGVKNAENEGISHFALFIPSFYRSVIFLCF